MIYQHPNIAPRAFIFAHELAHNLNAAHDEDSANALPNNIMELTPNDGSNGFSQASIDSIMHELLDPNNTCIHIEIQNQLRQFQYECRCYLDPGVRALSNRSMLG